MKEFIISLHRNVTSKLINSQKVFAVNIEQAYQLAKETFKPQRGQFAGAEAMPVLNKSNNKTNRKNG
jgi:hypothetical protein